MQQAVSQSKQTELDEQIGAPTAIKLSPLANGSYHNPCPNKSPFISQSSTTCTNSPAPIHNNAKPVAATA